MPTCGKAIWPSLEMFKARHSDESATRNPLCASSRTWGIQRFARNDVYHPPLSKKFLGIQTLSTPTCSPRAEFFANPVQTNQRVKLLWIGAGVVVQIIGDGARRLSEMPKVSGIQHKFHEREGGHTWINRRRYFHDFSQTLFWD